MTRGPICFGQRMLHFLAAVSKADSISVLPYDFRLNTHTELGRRVHATRTTSWRKNVGLIPKTM